MLRTAASCACRIALTVVCLTGALRAAENAAGEKHTLRYRFEPGSTLRYVVGDDTSMFIQVAATAEQVQYGSESGRSLQTISVKSDGSAVLQVTVEYVKLSAGNGAISWDSRSGEDPPAQFKGIENTIGKPQVALTISPTGQIVAAESGDNVASQTQLESTPFDLLPLLPEQPVAAGDSWTEPFEVDVVTSMKLTKKVSMRREYTLVGVEKGVAEISVRTSVLTPIQDPLEEGQLIRRTPSGTIRWDIAQGRLLERVMKLDNKVVGFQGPQTALRVVSTRQESLGSDEKTAAAPSDARNR